MGFIGSRVPDHLVAAGRHSACVGNGEFTGQAPIYLRNAGHMHLFTKAAGRP